jgi:DNA-binding transcriptional LysR family regulator
MVGPAMELRHLRYFVAVAEEQNVTRAAARLHVSQPPLSRQIQDLEAIVGVALFARTGKSVRLTEAGKVFLTEARAVLRRAEEAVAAARATANGTIPEFHLGYAPSPTVEILPSILGKFQERAPRVRVVLHDLTTPEMLAGLNNGKLNAALMVQPRSCPSRDLTFEKLREYPIVLALSPKHRFARLQSVSVSDVLEEPLVAYSRGEFPDYHEMLRRIVKRDYKRLRFSEQCDGVMSLIAAIQAGRGVAISAVSLAQTAGNRLRYVPFRPAPPPAIVAVAYSKRRLNPAGRLFLETCRGVVEVR